MLPAKTFWAAILKFMATEENRTGMSFMLKKAFNWKFWRRLLNPAECRQKPAKYHNPPEE